MSSCRKRKAVSLPDLSCGKQPRLNETKGLDEDEDDDDKDKDKKDKDKDNADANDKDNDKDNHDATPPKLLVRLQLNDIGPFDCHRQVLVDRYPYFAAMFNDARSASSSSGFLEAGARETEPVVMRIEGLQTLPLTRQVASAFFAPDQLAHVKANAAVRLETAQKPRRDPEYIWLQYQVGQFFKDDELCRQAVEEMTWLLRQPTGLSFVEHKLHYLYATDPLLFLQWFPKTRTQLEPQPKAEPTQVDDDEVLEEEAKDDEVTSNAAGDSVHDQATDEKSNRKTSKRLDRLLRHVQNYSGRIDVYSCMIDPYSLVDNDRDQGGGVCWQPNVDSLQREADYISPCCQQVRTDGHSGRPTLPPWTTVQERWRAWTGGLFDGYGLCPFPWLNVVIAGGFVVQLLQDQTLSDSQLLADPNMDIDVWILGCSKERERQPVIEYMEQWALYHGRDIFFDCPGPSVMTLRIQGIALRVQVMASTHRTAYGVVSNFDYTHLQCIYKNNRVFMSPHALDAFARRLSIMRRRYSVLLCNRLLKVLQRGFSVRFKYPNDVVTATWKRPQEIRATRHEQLAHPELGPCFPGPDDLCIKAKVKVKGKESKEDDDDGEEENHDSGEPTSTLLSISCELSGSEFRVGYGGGLFGRVVDYRYTDAKRLYQVMIEQSSSSSSSSPTNDDAQEYTGYCSLLTPPLRCHVWKRRGNSPVCPLQAWALLDPTLTQPVPWLQQFRDFLQQLGLVNAKTRHLSFGLSECAANRLGRVLPSTSSLLSPTSSSSTSSSSSSSPTIIVARWCLSLKWRRRAGFELHSGAVDVLDARLVEPLMQTVSPDLIRDLAWRRCKDDKACRFVAASMPSVDEALAVYNVERMLALPLRRFTVVEIKSSAAQAESYTICLSADGDARKWMQLLGLRIEAASVALAGDHRGSLAAHDEEAFRGVIPRVELVLPDGTPLAADNVKVGTVLSGHLSLSYLMLEPVNKPQAKLRCCHAKCRAVFRVQVDLDDDGGGGGK